MVWFFQLCHLIFNHLHPIGVLYHLRSRLEQRWTDCYCDRLAVDLRLHFTDRVLYGGVGVRLSDIGGNLLVGMPVGWSQGRILHGLAQLDRTTGDNSISGVRCGDVSKYHAEFIFSRVCIKFFAGGYHPAAVLLVCFDHGVDYAAQLFLGSDPGNAEQHFGLVACVWCCFHHRNSRHCSGRTPKSEMDVDDPDKQFRL